MEHTQVLLQGLSGLPKGIMRPTQCPFFNRVVRASGLSALHRFRSKGL